MQHLGLAAGVLDVCSGAEPVLRSRFLNGRNRCNAAAHETGWKR